MNATNPAGVEGGVVLGGCRLEKPLDAGGMGQVWLAHQLSLDRPVAVKVLSAHLAKDPEYVERFKREATLAAKIKSPYVVQTYDAGFERKLAFIVMELLEGRTLDEQIRGGGAFSEPQALHVLLQAARGLAAAHELGLVHRDIKPANVFLQRNGPAKILDFGLVHAEGSETRLTEPGTVMGTPHYMSPEQCDGKPAGPPADLYSLGATIYAALSGKPPFTAATPVAVLRLHLDKEPQPLREVRTDISAETEVLVSRLMAKDPSRRPPSAEAAALEAERIIRQLAGSPAEGTTLTREYAPTVKAPAPRKPRRRAAVVVAAGVLIILVVLAAVLLTRRAPRVRGTEVQTVTRFYKMTVRIIPDASATSRAGLLEIVIVPREGLLLSSAHGETHGHKHRVAEYGIDLSPAPQITMETTELLPPEIRAETKLAARFTLAPDARRGRSAIKIVHRYQAGEIGGALFESATTETAIDVVLE